MKQVRDWQILFLKSVLSHLCGREDPLTTNAGIAGTFHNIFMDS